LSKKYSTCERFTDENRTSVTACTKWVYDRSKIESSTVTDWDLVCGHNWLRASADSLFMLGVMMGSIGFGYLSDRYGRKPIFFASLVIQVTTGIAASFAPEFFTFITARIFVGATTSGVFLVAYVIALEMVGPKYRLYAGVICMMFFSVGYMLHPRMEDITDCSFTAWPNFLFLLVVHSGVGTVVAVQEPSRRSYCGRAEGGQGEQGDSATRSAGKSS
jgi:OCT family organic cation transporter-like MFS transporter 4/5